MAIPVLPPFYDMPYTTKEGKLTPEAHLHNDQTFQSLNHSVSLINSTITSRISPNNEIINDGNKISFKTSSEITALEPAAVPGTIWFNTTLGKLQVKISAGVVQTITST